MLVLNYTPMKEAQQLHMFDECSIVTISGVVDSYGDYIETEAVASGIYCGFQETNGSERYGQITIENLDAVFRLPSGTQVLPKDKIRLTSYRGESRRRRL